jgi:hypothetical protein
MDGLCAGISRVLAGWLDQRHLGIVVSHFCAAVLKVIHQHVGRQLSVIPHSSPVLHPKMLFTLEDC